MHDLDYCERGGLVRFSPSAAKRRDADVDLVIARAKRTLDWPLLERAVDQKIADQTEFVAWWRRTVTPSRTRKSVNAGRHGQISVADAEGLTGIKQPTVSRWTTRLKDPEKYRAFLFGTAWRAAMGPGNPHVLSSQSCEYYTPKKYIQAARTVLGGIDLDPASCAVADKTVRTKRYYTIEQDRSQAAVERDGVA